MKKDEIARVLDAMRSELSSYLTRFVIRPELAEELVQETALRALQHLERAPDSVDEYRPWLFRIATNLAIDARRKQSFRREHLMETLRGTAKANAEFVARTRPLIGTPEMRSIAKEHLAFCLRCAVHNVSGPQAAALLLKAFHGLSNRDIADVLAIAPAQVKNRLQEARGVLRAHYGTTCALITQEGACFQCKELDGYYQAGGGNPLSGTAGDVEARLNIGRVFDPAQPTRWQSMLLELVNQLDGVQ